MKSLANRVKVLFLFLPYFCCLTSSQRNEFLATSSFISPSTAASTTTTTTLAMIEQGDDIHNDHDHHLDEYDNERVVEEVDDGNYYSRTTMTNSEENANSNHILSTSTMMTSSEFMLVEEEPLYHIRTKRQVIDSSVMNSSITSNGGPPPPPRRPPLIPGFVFPASSILNYNDIVTYVNSNNYLDNDNSMDDENDGDVFEESNRGGAISSSSSSNSRSSDGKMCRQQEYLPLKLFNLHSCAYCYYYMRDDNDTSMFDKPSRKWEKRTTIWKMSSTGNDYRVAVLSSKKNTSMTVFANVENPATELLSTFVSDLARQKWVDCCRAAERCCEKIATTNPYGGKPKILNGEEPENCVATWDGWQCWNSTSPGTKTHALCPNYIYFVLREAPSCTVMAEKVCTTNGTWFVKGRGEWTNYASCASAVIEVQKRRNYVHIMAYLVSIITIIPALVVFFAYKQLRVHRIILHQNFLFSMLINGLLVVAFKTIVILSELRVESHANSISSQNGIPCRLLLILTKYSRMTNYMWMFCESFYLHRLIAAAFAEQKSLLVFYIIGWVFPVIPTGLYAGFRIAWANEKCWVEPVEYLEWILNVPSLLSLLFNMLFLINIIRVLLTKLRANNSNANEPSQYRKAVKATLILLPLFGLHFVVTIYRPPTASGTCEWIEIYYFVNDILDGLQGFLVALIFCYLNGEVVLLFKRTYSRWRESHGRSSGGGGGGSCLRQPSSTTRQAQNNRQSRGGSMLGRSIVSTQCYSSVPASPEIITRLALTTPAPASTTNNTNSTSAANAAAAPLSTTANNNGSHYHQHHRHKNLVNGGNGPSSKSAFLLNVANNANTPTASTPSANNSPSPNHNSESNSLNNSLSLTDTIVQIKNNDPINGWAEVKLNNVGSGSSDSGFNNNSNNCIELKPQTNATRIGSGNNNNNHTKSGACNGGINGEHQL